ncbi:MAG TPA: FAD-binding protein [Chloroflexi bacterium]|nr:FAD-binding protein [Chloroflexota bacterium]
MAAKIVVYGTTWCPDCKRAKQFFGEHRIQYDWVDIEQDKEAAAYVEKVNNGARSVPTIIFPDGSRLVEPSNAELAEKLGLQTKAQRSFYDVIIIGGGPTGLSAAIYTGREGLDTLVIERAALGGQAGVTQVLDNFPGFDEGISGAEFARRLANQARRFGSELLEAQEVAGIQRDGQYLCVRTADGAEYGAKAVLIATGSKYRRLNIPGEDELIGGNVHFCATCDGAFYRDKEVLVIGGGNSGFEEGLFLTRFARKVTIVEFAPQVKASAILQEKVAGRDDMEVITNHAVKEFRRTKDNRLAAVLVENRATGEVVEWHPDGVFVFIGLSPNADFVPEEIERDRWGFIRTTGTLMASLPGVFAAGDVRAGSTKQAAAAAGEGVTAALMMRQYLKSLGDA